MVGPRTAEAALPNCASAAPFLSRYRLKLLYVMNEILRQSKARRGERDKYGEGLCQRW